MNGEQPQPINENEELQTTNEQEHESQPRIYVASLADYNAGRLHGRWVNAAQSSEALHAAINEMLAASREPSAEEWAIHDYEGFGPLRLGEYESIEKVANVARAIAKHGPAFAAWVAEVGIDETEEMERFEECFLGHFESIDAYVEQYVEDIGIETEIDKLAGPLAPYVRIDVEALGRDMLLGGDLSAVEAEDGGVYIFGP